MLRRSNIKNIIRDAIEEGTEALVDEEIEDIAENATDKLMESLDDVDDDEGGLPEAIPAEQLDDEEEGE